MKPGRFFARGGWVIVGVAAALGILLMLVLEDPSASANDPTRQTVHKSVASGVLTSHSTGGPWAFLAIVAVCLSGVALLVVLGGHRSARRRERHHGASHR